MMINRPAAMALFFLPLLLVLLLATGGQADTDEPSTSHHTIPEAPAPKGYESPKSPPASTGGHRQKEIKIGACFPSRDANNALSSDRGNNASNCLKRCTSKGYAGGLCDTTPDGLPGDCFCVVTLDGRA